MSYEFYRVLHISGIIMIFVGLGAYLANSFGPAEKRFPGKRFVAITHGIGMALTLVAGFGLLARLGIMGGWPGWVIAKFGIWLALGLILAVIIRKHAWAKPLWVLIIVLGITAAYFARYKPF